MLGGYPQLVDSYGGFRYGVVLVITHIIKKNLQKIWSTLSFTISCIILKKKIKFSLGGEGDKGGKVVQGGCLRWGGEE